MNRAAALTAVLLLGAFFALNASRADTPRIARAATTLVVNLNTDTGDGMCDATCTLRDALGVAVNGDSINFNIPGGGTHTIQMGLTGLAINTSILVDAQTQPGFNPGTGAPVIEVLGPGFAGENCISVIASNVTIRGFAIGNCNKHGIVAASVATGLRIEGNYLGLRADGTTPTVLLNGVNLAGTSDVIIGGSGVTKRNVISSAILDGIVVNRNAAINPSNIRIQGNYIGTNGAGSVAKPNGTGGIRIISATNVLIGVDSNGGAANVISGNNADGLLMDPTGVVDAAISAITIGGNKIGLNAAGAAALPNQGTGIHIKATNTSSSVNYGIGGTSPARRNVISGNAGEGILIDPNVSIVSIVGNYIGLGSDGLTDLGNALHGIKIASLASNIGGIVPAFRNVISGNSGAGIFVNTDGLQVLSNWIGSDAITGTLEKANNGGGIILNGQNTIGEAGQGNVISGNGNDGILITASAGGSTIKSNLIGVSADGTARLGQGTNGIRIANSSNNTIGGINAGEGNVISGNGLGNIPALGNGILIENGSSNTVVGNLIGTNATGTAAIMNLGAGVRVNGGADNEFGKPNDPNSGNVISGNGGDGVLITASIGVSQFYRNRIGTNAAGTGSIPNAKNGVRTAATLGFGDPVRRNIIANNGHNGVCIEGSVGTNLGNSLIHSNGRLGIDISEVDDCAGAVLANDNLDGDSGVNGRQNAPVLSNLIIEQFQTIITTTFNSLPNQPFTVSYFSGVVCGPNGLIGDALPVGGSFFLTDGAGNPSVNPPASLSAVSPGHTAVAAYATGPDGTSEFSNCVQDLPDPLTITTITNPLRVVPGGSNLVGISLTGTGFIDGVSTLHVNGTPVANTIVTGSTLLFANAPASLFANPGLARITVRNGATESNARNLPVCGGDETLVSGAHGTLWCGKTIAKANIDSQINSVASAVFRWKNSGQQFEFWFKGFPDNFNTLAGISAGEFYFFQSSGGDILQQGIPSGPFAYPQPGEAFNTAQGARGQVWGGTLIDLDAANPINAAISAIFRWNNGSQQFNFWFRGFPVGFQTLHSIPSGSFNFFQASTANIPITMP